MSSCRELLAAGAGWWSVVTLPSSAPGAGHGNVGGGCGHSTGAAVVDVVVDVSGCHIPCRWPPCNCRCPARASSRQLLSLLRVGTEHGAGLRTYDAVEQLRRGPAVYTAAVTTRPVVALLHRIDICLLSTVLHCTHHDARTEANIVV